MMKEILSAINRYSVGSNPTGGFLTCELYPTEKATIKLTYGLYESGVHAHSLSQKACNELWEKCNPLVNLGLMHWSMKPI